MLDQVGRTLWSRDVWEPETAIAPDGSFMAFSIVEPPGSEFPGSRPNEDRYFVGIVGRDGVERIRRQLPLKVEGISDSGRCVLTRGPVSSDRIGRDLVGLDSNLRERFRFDGAYGSNGRLMAASGLFIQFEKNWARLYRLPSCETKTQ